MVPLPQVQAAEKSTTPAEHAQIETGVVAVEPGMLDKADDLTFEGIAIPTLWQRSGCHRGSSRHGPR
jgi:hypothetical protein